MSAENDQILSEPEVVLGGLRPVPADPDKLLEPWLTAAKNVESSPNATAPEVLPKDAPLPCSQAAMQFFADGPEQPKAPSANATDEQWDAYNKAKQVWRQQSNEHVEEFDLVMKYDKLEDNQRDMLKDDLKRFLLNPESPNAHLSNSQSDGAVKSLEQGITSVDDARKWMKAISDWDLYQTKCI